MSQTYDYFGNINQDLLSRIPQSASRVLEVGCGSGFLGAAYKTFNPLATYVGVEFVSEVAQSAKERLDDVVCGDVEDPQLAIPLVDGEKYDCIVYGDVLEHLRNPWKVLKRHLGLLSDSGIVLACIPNVQHWRVIANLLAGQWPLTDGGIFDRTHLRWFTRSTILEWFRDLNLFVYDFQPRVPISGLEQSKDFVEKLLPAINYLQLEPRQVTSGMSALQYVIAAGRMQRQSLKIEGFSNLEPVSMAEVRLAQPLRAMSSCPSVQSKVHLNQMEISPSPKHVHRVLIWQRPIFRLQSSDLENLKKLIQCGYLLIIDWDDDPSNWPILAEDDNINFKMVHAVQVSKPELAHLVRRWNPNVAVFPNMVERLYPLNLQARKAEGLRMFFGALNRENDWIPLLDGLNSVFRADPEFWSVSVVHDRQFFERLELPDSQKSFMPLCSHSDYNKEMSRCDFAFLPLADNRFNRFKSDLKALEAAANGLAVLASSIVYEDTVRPGHTGEIFKTSSQLVAHLSAWRENPDVVRKMGLNSREWVASERMHAYQVKQREAWYRQLADNRDQLNRQLLERVPELASERSA